MNPVDFFITNKSIKCINNNATTVNTKILMACIPDCGSEIKLCILIKISMAESKLVALNKTHVTMIK